MLWKTFNGSSIRRRASKGLLFINELQKVFYLQKSLKKSSNFRKFPQAMELILLPIKELQKFFCSRNCSWSSNKRIALEGLLRIKDHSKVFQSQKCFRGSSCHSDLASKDLCSQKIFSRPSFHRRTSAGLLIRRKLNNVDQT